ncbi:2-polyprenyl-6-methoxyphenol hydroxylase-like FAD-dependent oxidoreductase [Nonomuraea thailandensis]|uniref:2-polyprenyl-6-methoxyphenol hydroxylase-like FAD-dependent oxidoreductase n=1 Tax=Nonomuraea thailandensis TaxID=1188745 RepID=A0A9X2K218_9ACTN|nr:FAD-dependent monooxygenase [Nonomuraea thailandensis]MCP2356590.1 2-polyprenyl-6-methoxyphenol hydroxylase-like FAD-dependent oxidoreductase [Nonomuraea thailandensis]
MQRRALVVGLGIAGMSAAIGLRQAGWRPVIVERATERRRGGYFVGLMPQGRQAAADLGIAGHLHTRNPPGGGKAYSLTRRGNREPGLGFLHQPGAPAAVVRGDIEAALWQGIRRDGTSEPVDVRFATKPVEIDDTGTDVRVLLENTGTGAWRRESFDLVVGADGLRSSVRRMVFGPHEDFMTTWDAMICAFQLQAQVPSFAAADSVISAREGRGAWVFGFADLPPTALLTYRTGDVEGQFAGSTIERLRTAFSDMDDPVVRHALDSLEQAPDFLFDSVHQVKMPRWSRERVVLVGDAAWCLNLYSGMGATFALRGGAELGRALRESPGDLGVALTAWESRLRPAITRHQRLARMKQQLFVPSSRPAEALRSVVLRLACAARERRLAKARAAGGSTP